MITDEYEFFDFEEGSEEEEETEYSHEDDGGQPCNCTEQEAIVQGDIVLCPFCRSTDIDLACGDHGYRCTDCNGTFTVC